jgi:hypothetical protein
MQSTANRLTHAGRTRITRIRDARVALIRVAGAPGSAGVRTGAAVIKNAVRLRSRHGRFHLDNDHSDARGLRAGRAGNI